MTNHDAHQGLPTSILSVDEHRHVIHHLMQKKFRHWKDFGILWNMCQATFIHQDTCHQLCLPHLCAGYAHGPIEEGPNKTMLSIIPMPGTHSANNRTNQTCTTNQRTPKKYKKRVVGVYRHKSVLQCTTGFVAILLIVKLHHANDLSFIQPHDSHEKLGWQKVHVLETWKNNDSSKQACHKTNTIIMD